MVQAHFVFPAYGNHLFHFELTAVAMRHLLYQFFMHSNKVFVFWTHNVPWPIVKLVSPNLLCENVRTIGNKVYHYTTNTLLSY